jgi:hypothetical protein
MMSETPLSMPSFHALSRIVFDRRKPFGTANAQRAAGWSTLRSIEISVAWCQCSELWPLGSFAGLRAERSRALLGR